MSDKPKGKLTFTIHRADGLRDVQFIGKQDPFVEVTCGSEVFKTKVHEDGGKNPSWEQAFMFNLDGTQDVVRLVVKDKDLLKDEPIARVDVNLVQLLATGQPTWFNVVHPSKFTQNAGKILLTGSIEGQEKKKDEKKVETTTTTQPQQQQQQQVQYVQQQQPQIVYVQQQPQIVYQQPQIVYQQQPQIQYVQQQQQQQAKLVPFFTSSTIGWCGGDKKPFAQEFNIKDLLYGQNGTGTIQLWGCGHGGTDTQGTCTVNGQQIGTWNNKVSFSVDSNHGTTNGDAPNGLLNSKPIEFAVSQGVFKQGTNVVAFTYSGGNHGFMVYRVTVLGFSL